MNAYLTIDDAPSTTLDEKLDTLVARGVPAVFFCEGRRLDDHAALAERAVEAGYHLGNHTYSHPHASDLSVAEFEAEVARTEERIDAVYERAGVSRPAKLFRFPFGDDGGERAPAFQRVLREGGFVGPAATTSGDESDSRDWSWTLDAEDWTTDDRTELRARFDAATRAATGDEEVMLFHDAGNDVALFSAFVAWLDDSAFSLSDPLELVR